jgi:hypothetical protein
MKIIKVVIFAVSIFALFALNIDAAIFANESCGGFGGGKSIDPCDPGGGKSAIPTIGQLLIEGGGYFLKSHSEIMLFLNKIELSALSGPDYKELQEIINTAINNMESAIDTYYELKSLAEGTPYNQEVIVKLMSFDYLKFQEENGLNPAIFKEVEKFLSAGDIRGIYNEIFLNFGELLEHLNTVKTVIDKDTFPEISILWRLNQKYSEIALFGQYVAEVFYNIK